MSITKHAIGTQIKLLSQVATSEEDLRAAAFWKRWYEQGCQAAEAPGIDFAVTEELAGLDAAGLRQQVATLKALAADLRTRLATRDAELAELRARLARLAGAEKGGA